MSTENQQQENKSNSVDAGFKAVTDQLAATQSDFSKKLDSVLAKLDQATAKQAANQVPEDDIETLMITNPKKAYEKIKAEVSNEVHASVNSQNNAVMEFNQTFSTLASEYPEIADQSSKLYARGKQLLAEFSNGKANDAAALERAVLKAATEQGVLPMKHRAQQSNDDDTYSGSGNSSSSNDNGRRKSSKKDDLDPRTIDLARLMGRPVDDPKYIERLKDIQKKRNGNWKKYS